MSSRASPNFRVGPCLVPRSRVYDAAGNVIETHEHKGDSKEWVSVSVKQKSRHAVKQQLIAPVG